MINNTNYCLDIIEEKIQYEKKFQELKKKFIKYYLEYNDIKEEGNYYILNKKVQHDIWKKSRIIWGDSMKVSKLFKDAGIDDIYERNEVGDWTDMKIINVDKVEVNFGDVKIIDEE